MRADRELGRVARGGAANLFGAAIYGASSFILLWVLNRELGSADAGVVLVAIAVFSILAKIAELGCATGLIRWLAHWRALDRRDLLVATARTALVPVLGAGIVFAVVVRLAAGPIAGLFADGRSETRLVADLIGLMAWFLPFASLQSVLVQGTRGFDTMRPQVAIEKVGRALLMPVAVFVAHRLGAGPVGVGLAWAATYPAALVPAAWSFRTLLKTHAAGTESASGTPELRRDYWGFTGARALGQTFEVAVAWVDTLLVAAILTTTDAGRYASGTRYVIVGMFIGEAVMQVCGPRVSGFMARGDSAAASDLLRTTTGWQTALTWPVYLVTIGFAPVLLSVFGPEVVAVRGALVALSIGLLSFSLAGPAGSVILMAGRGSLALLDTVVAVTFNLVGNLIAIPRWGVTGAGVVWAITLQLQSWLPSLQARYLLGVRTVGYQGPLAAGLALGTVGVGTALSASIVGTTVNGLMVALLVGGGAYAAALWSQRERLGLSALWGTRRNGSGTTAPAVLDGA